MALIENKVGAALWELRKMRGALMIISDAGGADLPADYDGLTGQIDALSCMAEKQLESLDRVIKDLGEVALKQ